MSEIPNLFDNQERLVSSSELVAAHLVLGGFSGLRGLDATLRLHQELINSAIPPAPAAILAADAMFYSIIITGNQGIIDNYSLFRQSKQPIVAALFTTAVNAQLQKKDVSKKCLQLLHDVTSHEKANGLSDLGAAVLITDALKKNLNLMKVDPLLECWANTLELVKGQNLSEYTTAHLATGLLQASPKWLMKLAKMPERVMNGFSGFQKVANNNDAAAVLTSHLMKHHSYLNASQKIESWYHEAKEVT